MYCLRIDSPENNGGREGGRDEEERREGENWQAGWSM